MKKLLLPFLFLLLLHSCEIAEVASTGIPLTKAAESCSNNDDYSVSETDATIFAQSFLSKEGESFSLSPYASHGDTLLYIINFDNGWKVLSADVRTAPILAESETGSFNLSGDLPVPLQIILNDAEAIVQSAKTENTTECAGYSSAISAIRHINKKKNRDNDAHWVKVLLSTSNDTCNLETVNHLIQTTWDNDSLWNVKAPVTNNTHCKNSCTAVAIGQAMYYFHQLSGSPSALYENLTLQNPNTTPLEDQISLGLPTTNSSRWSSMKTSRQASSGNAVYVADLLSSIDKRLGAGYTLPSTVTDITISSVLYLGLSGSVYSTNGSISSSIMTTILNNLRNNKPVIVAKRSSAGADPLHVWIIDGLVRQQETISYTYGFYYVNDPSSLNGQYNGYNIVGIYTDDEMASLYPGYMNGSQHVDQYSIESTYLLMNWGMDDGIYDSIRQNLTVWVANGTTYSNEYREVYYNLSGQ